MRQYRSHLIRSSLYDETFGGCDCGVRFVPEKPLLCGDCWLLPVRMLVADFCMLARIRGTLKYAYVRRTAGGCGTAAGSSLVGSRKIPVGTVVMKSGRRCMLSPLLLCVCMDYREQDWI